MRSRLAYDGYFVGPVSCLPDVKWDQEGQTRVCGEILVIQKLPMPSFKHFAAMDLFNVFRSIFRFDTH